VLPLVAVSVHSCNSIVRITLIVYTAVLEMICCNAQALSMLTASVSEHALTEQTNLVAVMHSGKT
jgi:hypothetical protein